MNGDAEHAGVQNAAGECSEYGKPAFFSNSVTTLIVTPSRRSFLSAFPTFVDSTSYVHFHGGNWRNLYSGRKIITV